MVLNNLSCFIGDIFSEQRSHGLHLPPAFANTMLVSVSFCPFLQQPCSQDGFGRRHIKQNARFGIYGMSIDGPMLLEASLQGSKGRQEQGAPQKTGIPCREPRAMSKP